MFSVKKYYEIMFCTFEKKLHKNVLRLLIGIIFWSLKLFFSKVQLSELGPSNSHISATVHQNSIIFFQILGKSSPWSLTTYLDFQFCAKMSLFADRVTIMKKLWATLPYKGRRTWKWRNMKALWRIYEEYGRIWKKYEEIWRKYEEIMKKILRNMKELLSHIWAVGLGKISRGGGPKT